MTLRKKTHHYLLVLVIILTSCGTKKVIPAKYKTKLTKTTKRSIEALNTKLEAYKYEDLIESQIIKDTIVNIQNTPYLFINKETQTSSEKIGFSIYAFKKLKIKKKNNMYLAEIKVKPKEMKSNISIANEDDNDALLKYDFILKNISRTQVKDLKLELKKLIKSLKQTN